MAFRAPAPPDLSNLTFASIADITALIQGFGATVVLSAFYDVGNPASWLDRLTTAYDSVGEFGDPKVYNLFEDGWAIGEVCKKIKLDIDYFLENENFEAVDPFNRPKWGRSDEIADFKDALQEASDRFQVAVDAIEAAKNSGASNEELQEVAQKITDPTGRLLLAMQIAADSDFEFDLVEWAERMDEASRRETEGNATKILVLDINRLTSIYRPFLLAWKEKVEGRDEPFVDLVDGTQEYKDIIERALDVIQWIDDQAHATLTDVVIELGGFIDENGDFQFPPGSRPPDSLFRVVFDLQMERVHPLLKPRFAELRDLFYSAALEFWESFLEKILDIFRQLVVGILPNLRLWPLSWLFWVEMFREALRLLVQFMKDNPDLWQNVFAVLDTFSWIPESLKEIIEQSQALWENFKDNTEAGQAWIDLRDTIRDIYDRAMQAYWDQTLNKWDAARVGAKSLPDIAAQLKRIADAKEREESKQVDVQADIDAAIAAQNAAAQAVLDRIANPPTITPLPVPETKIDPDPFVELPPKTARLAQDGRTVFMLPDGTSLTHATATNEFWASLPGAPPKIEALAIMEGMKLLLSDRREFQLKDSVLPPVTDSDFSGLPPGSTTRALLGAKEVVLPSGEVVVFYKAKMQVTLTDTSHRIAVIEADKVTGFGTEGTMKRESAITRTFRFTNGASGAIEDTGMYLLTPANIRIRIPEFVISGSSGTTTSKDGTFSCQQ